LSVSRLVAILGGDQDANRSIPERGGRRQRFGVAQLDIVERKTGMPDRLSRPRRA
jgi:hypothetical protein